MPVLRFFSIVIVNNIKFKKKRLQLKFNIFKFWSHLNSRRTYIRPQKRQGHHRKSKDYQNSVVPLHSQLNGYHTNGVKRNP